jgi:hypothetical protein
VLCGEILLENSIGFHEVSYEVSGSRGSRFRVQGSEVEKFSPLSV